MRNAIFIHQIICSDFMTIDLHVFIYLCIFKPIKFFYKRNKKYTRLIVDAKITLETKVVVVMLINILLSSSFYN